MQKVDYSQLELNPFLVFSEDTFLLSAGENDDWNTMTAGWGGFGSVFGVPAAYVFVRKSRYTHSFIERYPMFSLSFFPNEMKIALDYCGSHSGREGNKAAEAGITPFAIDGTVAFEEANLIMTCRKMLSVPITEETMIDASLLKFYPHGDWHQMFIGAIEGVYIP